MIDVVRIGFKRLHPSKPNLSESALGKKAKLAAITTNLALRWALSPPIFAAQAAANVQRHIWSQRLMTARMKVLSTILLSIFLTGCTIDFSLPPEQTSHLSVYESGHTIVERTLNLNDPV